MLLLTASLEMEDSCWEQRLRTGMLAHMYTTSCILYHYCCIEPSHCFHTLTLITYMYMYVVVRLFRKAQAHPSPAVMAGVTMPCLKILNFLICPSDPKSKQNQASLQLVCIQ